MPRGPESGFERREKIHRIGKNLEEGELMGRRPDLSGEVSDLHRNKVGRISLWTNDKENGKQPDYTGTVSFKKGENKFRIAAWKQRDGERKGKDGEEEVLEI